MKNRFLKIAVLAAAAAFVTSFPRHANAQAGIPPIGDEYRTSTFPEAFAGNTFYPATELRAVPVARARLLAAREMTRQAYSALTNSVQDIKRTYAQSEELRDAAAEEHAAWMDLEDARHAAVSRVANDRNYQAALALRARIAAQVQSRNADENAGVEGIISLATVKLSYSATASAMEAAAISADDHVRDARLRLVKAGQRLSDLKMRFEQSVRTDAAVLGARQMLASARMNELAAEGFFVEARANRLWATNYAYYLAAPQAINYPYGYPNYGGYGYSNGNGYGFGYPMGWTGASGTAFRR